MRRVLRLILKPGDELFHRVVNAGFWAFTIRVVVRSLTIVRTIILARLLAPEDFGLMAIATLSILLVERLSQTGFDAALVQRDGDIRPYLDTAWTLQLLRGLVMGATLFLAAPLIAGFFGAPEALPIVRVLSITVAFRGFTNIGVVYFVKDLRFDRQFALDVSDKGLNAVVSIVAAVVLRNAWALVLGVVVGSLARVVVSYLIDDYRPRLRWDGSRARRLFRFGKWLFVTNALVYAIGNLDDIMVGRILGVAALGYYRMAYNFSQAVATELTQVVNQVGFPTYSRLQADVGRLRTAYFGALHAVAFVAFPLAIGTILVAEELTIGVLGAKWLPIIRPMQLLSVAGLVRSLAATTGPLFQGQGRPDFVARFAFGQLIVLSILLYPATSRFGLNGAAGVVAIGAVLTGVPAIALAYRRMVARWTDVVETIGFPAINTLFMAVVVLGVESAFFAEPTWQSFVVLAAVGVLAYGFAVLVSMRFLPYDAPSRLVGRLANLMD